MLNPMQILASAPRQDVRFGSKADITFRPDDVRFNSKADIEAMQIDVRFVPIADI
jgi:hypothetical protein